MTRGLIAVAQVRSERSTAAHQRRCIKEVVQLVVVDELVRRAHGDEVEGAAREALQSRRCPKKVLCLLQQSMPLLSGSPANQGFTFAMMSLSQEHVEG